MSNSASTSVAVDPVPGDGQSPARHPSFVYEFDASRSRFSYAAQDIRRALAQPGLIWTLIRINFLQRYRGILRGAFWIVLLSAATALGMGVIYGRLFGADASSFFPYVVTGIIVWSLLSSLVNDSAGVFVAASGVFNETPIPKSIFVFRMIGVAAISFAFRLVVIVGCFAVVGHLPTVQGFLLAMCGFLLILWTAIWFALGWGVICARHRDLLQTTSVALTFTFFVSAAFWYPDRLGKYEFIVHLNPLYHYINVVRGPLLGLDGTAWNFAVAGGCTILTMICGGVLFGLFSRRLSYWT